MAELLRILVAFLILFMQQLGQGPAKLFPVVSTPTTAAPPTATPTATATRTATRAPTATRTATRTPQATPTPTPFPTARPSSADPVGFEVTGVPPAQKLPSALLIYPLVRASGSEDTRIELMNLTSQPVSAQCFYVTSGTCNEIGFFVTLTANQPISWMVGAGSNGNGRRVAPAFFGDGELKCIVVPRTPDLSSHNALQGRGLLSDASGQTLGYAAIGFRRLTPGDFSGVVPLDGITYEQCPDRLHFQVLPSQGGPDSELVLVPCSQDLLLQVPSTAKVQLAVINEFEQRFSGATTVKCFNRLAFSSLPPLRQSSAGTDTAHLIVRGTDVPVVGLVIDRFTVPGGMAVSTSSNAPFLEGGRPAIVHLP
ncbi:MAG: hypothetical protein ACE5I7_09535 [Candidatus Binatia bacterium]